MARTPVDQRLGGSEPRDRIWARIRRLGPDVRVTAPEMAVDAKCAVATARDYLSALVASGRLGYEASSNGLPARYWIVRDTGLETPRIRPDGSPVTMGAAREQMWRAMRGMGGNWSATDLAFQASTEAVGVSEIDAADYAKHLAAAGYLRRTDAGRYVTVPAMRTGPKPPQVQRTKAVYDPNLGRVVWTAVAGDAR